MTLAYDIAEEISECRTNIERGDFALSVLERIAKETGRKVVKTKIPRIGSNRGKYNYQITSEEENPILVCAHYDSERRYLFCDETFPGANDNGSGVGAAVEVFRHLNDSRVSVVLFGAEERNFLSSKKGSAHYVKNSLPPKFALNFDCCGSGSRISFQVDYPSFLTNPMNEQEVYMNIATNLGKETHLSHANSDHLNFLMKGIPAGIITGFNPDFYPKKIRGQQTEGIVHTEKDTMNWVDLDFLKRVVEIGVLGTEKILEINRKNASGF